MTVLNAAPSLEIPFSKRTVEVCIIDTTTKVNGLPASAFMTPSIPGYQIIRDGCEYAFVIKHTGSDKIDTLIFDLGVRKDFENSPPVIVEQSANLGLSFSVESDVASTLVEHGQDLDGVDAIIWSHYHSDHAGDPCRFPTSTALIVGPGFKDAFVPGWPTIPDSQLDEKAWKDRELREISFEEATISIGDFKAVDYFNDGSLFLLNSPGHATGHMCALARTSAEPPEFILMGADIAHHGGQFRPSKYMPLPEDIRANPLIAPYQVSDTFCPGALFQQIHPHKRSTEPFMKADGFIHDDAPVACQSIEGLLKLDAHDNIFTVIAHDKSLLDVVEFYPKSANSWKTLGWKEQSRWRFLRDFDTEEGYANAVNRK
ncbi:hypothetical protein OPT61_g6328 [Boeremia exigua]|uniref:Uncharacterized protein n=1 Tax=Boeremia exigua TaxID=749465 RepID=A0ACC2I7C5_9PLEO|nr:hypothetical protein OPT61_g6328 [Boeremia exigua]